MEVVTVWTKDDAATLLALEAEMTALTAAAEMLWKRAIVYRDEHALLQARACADKIEQCERYMEGLRAKRDRSEGGGSDLFKGCVFIASLVVFTSFRVFRSLSR